MFYYLFNMMSEHGVPGARLMDYVTFRSGCAFVLAMLIAIFFGRRIIDRLQRMQVGEIIRNLGLEGQMKKTGTPTMGGVIIIISIIIPCLLVSKLENPYMILMLVSTLWLGTLGFMDDYKKLAKHDKEGMKGKYKIIGQVGIGIIVAGTMYMNPDMGIRVNHEVISAESGRVEQVIYENEMEHTPATTIPFVKDNNFNYSELTSFLHDNSETGGWIAFLLVTIFFVAATSNGANLTDGLDGLTTGCSAIIGVALVLMAYLGGNLMYSSYLNIMYVPGSEELVVYMAAFIGALVGFLWYNAYPAQVFMGDTGSLTIGTILSFLSMAVFNLRPDQAPDASENLFVLAVTPLLIPLLDVIRVFCHRVRKHNNPFLPDRCHIHHKLLALGFRTSTALITILVADALFISFNFNLSPFFSPTWIILFDTLIWVVFNWLLTRLIRSREKMTGIKLYD